MNPLLPRHFFMADAEAHVFPDGRLYMIGSTDISGSGQYCSHVYHLWSTDDAQLRHWVDHGPCCRTRRMLPRSPGRRAR